MLLMDSRSLTDNVSYLGAVSSTNIDGYMSFWSRITEDHFGVNKRLFSGKSFLTPKMVVSDSTSKWYVTINSGRWNSPKVWKVICETSRVLTKCFGISLTHWRLIWTHLKFNQKMKNFLFFWLKTRRNSCVSHISCPKRKSQKYISSV